MPPVWHAGRLAERVDYELWVVRALTDNESRQFTTFALEADTRLRQIGIHETLGDPMPFVRRYLSPLLFNAEFKVLDMFFEWVVSGNGREVPWTFDSKLNLLQNQLSTLSAPPPLDRDPELLPALSVLYSNLVPPRNRIVHDNTFEIAEGMLRVHGAAGQRILEFSSGDERALRRLVVTLVDALTGAIPDPEIAVYDLKGFLDRLQRIHGGRVFGVAIEANEGVPVVRKSITGEVSLDGERRFEAPLGFLHREIVGARPATRRYRVELVVTFPNNTQERFLWDSVLLDPRVESVSIRESDALWTRGRVRSAGQGL